MRFVPTFILALIAALLLGACGGGTAQPAPTVAPGGAGGNATAPTAPPVEAPATATLIKAVFARSLDENQAPIDETDSFAPDETIYFSMQFEGRPKQGLIAATFYWRETELATAEVDFADANSGVLFSFGESTFAGFNLTHENPLLISDNYRVEAFLDGTKLADYPFKVSPPADAIPSQINETTLARGATENYEPIDPISEFAPEDTVYLVGNADLGLQSWIQADWYVDGKLDEAGTRSLTMQENLSDGGFSFSFVPEGGWPLGEHEVVLTLNDEEVGRYSFTIAEAAQPEPVGDVAFTSFSSADGVFSIEVPEAWVQNDASESGLIAQSWFSDEELAGAFVQITAVETEAGTEELIAQLKDYLESTFGGDPEFSMGEAQEQGDGSQRILWASTPEINNESIRINGLSYIEQRGDKLSILTVVVPEERFDDLEPVLSRVLNSYSIDPAATIE